MKSKDFDLDFARRERYTYTKTSSSQGKVPGKSFGGSNTMSVALNTKHLSGFISEEEYAAIYPQVEAAHKQLEAKNGPGSDFLGWMYLPRDYDKEEFARIKAAAKKIREDSDVLVVAGIGGSYLGARAVVEAVKGQFHNELEGGPKIYFCGNSISPTYLNNILDLCKGKRFSINVISKSGTTTETSLAFRVLRELLEKEMGVEEANKRIYATTDRAKGTLKQLADAQGWPTFVVPDDVGGRYSVLSAVGLLPIAVAGIDIRAVSPSGGDGTRIIARDITAYLEAQKNAPAPAPAAAASAGLEDEITEIPWVGVKKTIARNMMNSLQTMAQNTCTLEVDCTDLLALREKYVADQEMLGCKITVNDLLCKMLGKVVAKHPLANATFDGKTLYTHKHVHLSVAVATEDGLMVPVVRNIDTLSLTEINAKIKDLAQRAKEKKLDGSEMTGGTFSITNVGMFPIDYGTPVINPPQTCICGFGRPKLKPAILPDGTVGARMMMNVFLTFDHQVIDGLECGRIFKDLEYYILHPEMILA